jgi:hypothetical protein
MAHIGEKFIFGAQGVGQLCIGQAQIGGALLHALRQRNAFIVQFALRAFAGDKLADLPAQID